MKNFKRTCFSIMVVFALMLQLLCLDATKVSAKEKTIDDYISCDDEKYQSDSISLNKSVSELEKGINFGTLKKFIDLRGSDDYKTIGEYFKLDVLANGCFLIKVNLTSGWFVRCNYSVAKDENYQYKYEEAESSTDGFLTIPVNAGQNLYVWQYFDEDAYYNESYLCFCNLADYIKVDYCVEEADGTYTIYFNWVNDEIEISRTWYSKQYVSAFDTYDGKGTWTDFGENTESSFSINVPKNGTYTICHTVNLVDGTFLEFIYEVNTKDYVKSSSKTLSTPLAMFAGTNVVVGKATPNATVNVKFSGKTYKVKTDNTGLYIVTLDKNLKKGNSVVIWQTEGKLNSKKRTFKVK